MTRSFLSFFLFFPLFINAQTEYDLVAEAEQAEINYEYKKAINFISKAIEMDSSNAYFYETRGRIIAGFKVENKQVEHIDKQSFRSALADFDKAIELDPYNPDFYQSRGSLFLNFRKYNEAFNDFEEELKYAYYIHQQIKAMSGKAKAKFAAKEIDASFRILEEALSVDSTSLLILNDLALQYLLIDDFEPARYFLNKALAIDQENKITLANMGYLALKSGKYEQALKIYNLVIENYPETGLLYSNRAFLKYKFEQYEEALQDINYSLELAPVNSYAYKNRALIYLATNQKDKACEDLLYAKSLGYTLDYDREVIDLLLDNCLKVNQKVKKKD